MKIRPMTADDLEFAASLSEIEGWDTSTPAELRALLEYDPRGCLIAEENGERLGTCFGTAYQTYGFIGELIVIDSVRGSGFGTRLLQSAIQDLHERGIKHIYLDGVPAALPLYERLGFHSVCRSFRFKGCMQGKPHADVRYMQEKDLEAVLILDRDVFGDDRSFFIKRRLRLYPNLCMVQEDGGAIVGFILGRPGRRDICSGPWICRAGSSSPLNLLESFALQAGSQDIRIGILEVNQEAVNIVESAGFARSAESPMRMVLGQVKYPGRPQGSFAVGSPAKG